VVPFVISVSWLPMARQLSRVYTQQPESAR
jgi:hypothetical protein